MKKFTLLELMVIVALFCILLSLLLPSLKQARDKVKDAVCMSNLKQISIGIMTYTSKSSGKFPSHNGSGKKWIEHINITQYDLYLCPRVNKWTYESGNTYTPDASTVANRWHFGTYGYNAYWLGLSGYDGTNHPMRRNFTRAADCATPSEVIELADSSPIDLGNRAIVSSTLWYTNRKRIGDRNEGIKSAHGNKSDRANIAFVDGHVISHKSYPINYNNEFKDWWNPDPLNFPSAR
jgi:prepilin-type processing-associated H-X9-DG protein